VPAYENVNPNSPVQPASSDDREAQSLTPGYIVGSQNSDSSPASTPEAANRGRSPRIYACIYQGCTRTFNCRSLLVRHSEGHTRLHKCGHADCTSRDGFSSRGVLDRHIKEVHELVDGGQFFCPEKSCPRHMSHPFKRQWNLDNHRKVHLKRPAKTAGTRGRERRTRVSQPSVIKTNPLPLAPMVREANGPSEGAPLSLARTNPPPSPPFRQSGTLGPTEEGTDSFCAYLRNQIRSEQTIRQDAERPLVNLRATIDYLSGSPPSPGARSSDAANPAEVRLRDEISRLEKTIEDAERNLGHLQGTLDYMSEKQRHVG
jgi:hypothetical protein